MTKQVVDIARDYRRSSDFYDAFALRLTVKSFDLQAIRSRYLQALSNKSGKGGSVERREVSEGGLAEVRIDKGQLTEERVLLRCKEPRGIARHGDVWAYSSENTVFVRGARELQITHPWFSYIHTLDFSRDGKRLLVASSGFDLIMEFDLHTSECVWEWWAWEHGYNRGTDADGHPVVLSRKPLKDADGRVLVITDPKKQVLPTAMRAAFINSVSYHPKDERFILATLFHAGSVIEIDRETGKSRERLGGMKSPHGGRAVGKSLMATSTGSGEVVVRQDEQEVRYALKGLPGKPTALADKEWLQNTLQLGEHYLAIDSNRTSFVIFNPELACYDTIAYNPDWAVQDGVVITI